MAKYLMHMAKSNSEAVHRDFMLAAVQLMEDNSKVYSLDLIEAYNQVRETNGLARIEGLEEEVPYTYRRKDWGKNAEWLDI